MSNNRNRYSDDYRARERNNYSKRDSRYRDRRDNYGDDKEYYYHDKSRLRDKVLILFLAITGVAIVAAGFYYINKDNNMAQIITVKPNSTIVKEPYKVCSRVGTSKYVQNKKSGTEGAIIGGATGAVAGGVIGNQIKQGGGGTLVGALVGGAAGAFVGDKVEKSNQPDSVEVKGSKQECRIEYKSHHRTHGYIVQYVYKDNIKSVILKSPPKVGSKIPFEQLQLMSVSNN